MAAGTELGSSPRQGAERRGALHRIGGIMTRARAGALAGALLLPAAVALAACGSEPSQETAADTTPASQEGLAPFCDDVERPGPVADGSVPTAGNPDMGVMAVLNAYGAEHPDTFGGMWIDRTHRTVVLAFTDDPDLHRAAIASRRASPDDPALVEPAPTITDTTTVAESGVSFDVVQVRYTAAALDDLQAEVAAVAFEGQPAAVGVGSAADLNRVRVSYDVVDDASRRRLAEVVPVDAVCVEGIPAAEAPEPVDPSDPPALLPGDDVALTCGGEGLTFPPSALDQPGGFESADDPLAEALRDTLSGSSELSGMGSPTGWRVLARTDEAAILADQDLASVTFRQEDGRWAWAGSGGCSPQVALPDGVGRAAVALDPAFPPPGPETTELHLLVSELACASGAPIGDRLLGPQVRDEGDRVVLATAVVSLGGMQTCPGNAAQPVTVALDEPLGDRTLVDGLVWPAAAIGPPGEGNGVMPGA